ncbi:MAG TPA: BON domain-containing protein [Vicinamibacterales bacterium]|nr:BON domain-containing protein [Vicinamibacterales bacterium]
MRRRTELTHWLGAAVLAMTLSGCSDRAEQKASDTANKAGNAAEKAGNATADAAKDAGSAVGNAVGNAGRAADAAVQTMDVKTALMADKRVDASDINVDTDHTTKTVTLKGHVPTADQKKWAEEIAVAKGNSYRVRNELTVGR